MEGTIEQHGWRRWGGKAALAVGGLLVGGVLAGTLTAYAANQNGAANQSGAYGVTNQQGTYGAQAGPRHGGKVDESKSQRPDEQLLTGDTATKVRAAALARYPGATGCGSRRTPTACTRPTSPPPTASGSPSRSTRPSRRPARSQDRADPSQRQGRGKRHPMIGSGRVPSGSGR